MVLELPLIVGQGTDEGAGSGLERVARVDGREGRHWGYMAGGWGRGGRLGMRVVAGATLLISMVMVAVRLAQL